MNRLHYASTHDANMWYLLGHHVGDPVVFLETAAGRYVFLPATDLEAYQAHAHTQGLLACDMRPFVRAHAGRGPSELITAVLAQYKVAGVVHVPLSFPAGVAFTLRDRGVDLVVDDVWLPERAQKRPDELGHIRTAAANTVAVFGLVEEMLHETDVVGDVLMWHGEVLTSERVKQRIEIAFLEQGFVCPEGIIVSCGSHAAMPHHSGTGPFYVDQPVVVDIFPRHRESGYFADMSRTYVVGKPSEQVLRMYTAVRAAQKAAVALLKPGARAKDVYQVSADTIQAHGFDVGETGYIHSLGHGVGVAVHEAPSLSGRSEDVLAPGHVVTIEPGLYYPEHGGVRLEDMYVITDTGAELLTEHPYTLRIS